MAMFERLEASVSQIETVSESIETLVHGIAAELRELKDRSDAGLAEFADRLDARAASMTSTVFEHTQVEPDGPDDPVDPEEPVDPEDPTLP